MGGGGTLKVHRFWHKVLISSLVQYILSKVVAQFTPTIFDMLLIF